MESLQKPGEAHNKYKHGNTTKSHNGNDRGTLFLFAWSVGKQSPVVTAFLVCCGVFFMCCGVFLVCCGVFLVCCGFFFVCCGVFLVCCGFFLVCCGFFLCCGFPKSLLNLCK
ncbi:hypothetical protein NL108_017580 [Boleophthalmus pectinirostris]|nr:hypothetical protein NL108_017580 [Boleophthalmus pectinirostris]